MTKSLTTDLLMRFSRWGNGITVTLMWYTVSGRTFLWQAD